MSCSTTPVLYSFVENGTENATISFMRGNPGVALIYFEGNELPEPEKKTHWDPLSFPAGKPLSITVHVYYQQANSSGQGLLITLVATAIVSSRSVDQDVLFECPALEAGKEYKLVFRKGAGLTGQNLLVLTDVSTKKIVYQQEFTTQ
jgi:hypothetical protein